MIKRAEKQLAKTKDANNVAGWANSGRLSRQQRKVAVETATCQTARVQEVGQEFNQH